MNQIENIEEYSLRVAIENLYQNLLENIADWLDSESTEFEVIMSLLEGLEDSEDLHIKMTQAAMKVFIQEKLSKTDEQHD